MKILVNLNTSWNIYNFRLGLINELLAQGHNVVAIAPYDDYTSKLEKLGIEVFLIDLDQKGINPFDDFKLYKQYKFYFAQIKPDLILSYTIKPNIYGNIAAAKLQIPVINNISGLGTLFIKKNILTFVGKLLYKIALSKSYWVFFQNKEDIKLFCMNNLVTPSKASIVPGSGVDIYKFKCNKNENKGLTYLFVGRLIGDKGINEFLQAARAVSKIHENVRFLIVGELGYNNKTAISEHDLKDYLDIPNITYLGKQDKMINILENADVLVLPSYREGLSKSLIEAASMSLPIITTDVPGCRDVVENNVNGLLCEPRNSISLQEAILQMISFSEEKRIEMGKLGREMIEKNFTQEIVIEKYTDKIKALINS